MTGGKKMIAKKILRKLEQIEAHQLAVKRLVAQVEEWAGIEDIQDGSGNCWAMDVDRQGQICDAGSSRAFLVQYLVKLRRSR